MSTRLTTYLRLCLLLVLAWSGQQVWGQNNDPNMGEVAEDLPIRQNSPESFRPVNCTLESTEDAYLLEQQYRSGEFLAIMGQEQCVYDLYQKTRPGANPDAELLALTEKFLHYYALSCLHEDEVDRAQNAAMMLLERFPHHAMDPDLDGPEFRCLLDSLATFASHQFGVYGGGTIAQALFTSGAPARTDITPGGGRLGPVSRPAPRYCFGFTYQRQLTYRQALLTGMGVISLSHMSRYASRAFDPDQAQLGDWTLKQFDKYTFLSLPLTYQYRLPLGRITRQKRNWLGLELGGFARLMVKAETELLNTQWVESRDANSGLTRQSNRVTISNPISRRNAFTFGTTAGVSWQSELGNVSFFVRGTADVGLSQMRKPGTEYQQNFQQYIWEYHLADRNFTLQNLSLMIGVMLPKSYRVKNFHTRPLP